MITINLRLLNKNKVSNNDNMIVDQNTLSEPIKRMVNEFMRPDNVLRLTGFQYIPSSEIGDV